MKKIVLLLALVNLVACASLMEDRDERLKVVDSHVDTPPPAVEQAAPGIPPVVEQVPIIAAPEPAEPMQTYTVVATDLPANELLFALARDARLNLDIDPAIDGRVSINAIDQTLPQILKRISRQVQLRYYLDGPNLVVEQDRPFVRLYRIEYLNMSRVTTSSVGIETALAAGDEDTGSTGDSSTSVSNESNNDFWQTLEANIGLLANSGDVEGTVISNRESGTISVLTTSSAHEDIQRFIDSVMGSARRQVLIEATVVEVTLNDEFQAGIDWRRMAVGDGWTVGQELLGSTTTLGSLSGGGPVVEAAYLNTNSDRDITAAIRALDTFGDVSVMSSPKIMALNNQTSLLKVADNTVYFEIDATTDTDEGVTTRTFNTNIKTVPVGFVMNVTPFITADNEVILNIRPTITRILRFVNDPNPTLAEAGVTSQVPEIQVREMESVLRVTSGDTAVIGGLMQDTASKNDAGLPGLHDAKGFGLLFGTKTREFDKSELVIFLRPRILDNASIETNLSDFKKFLKPEAFSGTAE
ncbi:MAG: pilus (MSHA type) biogenesis protein MshL [Gammaproteobacteria bacterium]|nr:pilus (MSHA type) biogenesis protein MshL [Gammaproteobacteria bacterium]MDH3856710.1 pilus (MSHA type) biogenesis protein MshL [Gammaproteobacteria bacterium]